MGWWPSDSDRAGAAAVVHVSEDGTCRLQVVATTAGAFRECLRESFFHAVVLYR